MSFKSTFLVVGGLMAATMVSGCTGRYQSDFRLEGRAIALAIADAKRAGLMKEARPVLRWDEA